MVYVRSISYRQKCSAPLSKILCFRFHDSTIRSSLLIKKHIVWVSAIGVLNNCINEMLYHITQNGLQRQIIQHIAYPSTKEHSLMSLYIHFIPIEFTAFSFRVQNNFPSQRHYSLFKNNIKLSKKKNNNV